MISYHAPTEKQIHTVLVKDVNCKGASERKNAWDNTCSNASFSPKSVWVEVYGGCNQKVYFYTHSNCLAGTEKRGPWSADHANNSRKVGACISKDGYAIKSFGSRL